MSIGRLYTPRATSAAKQQRLRELIRRLQAAPPAASFDDARLLPERTLNAVEDKMSGVPFDPARWQTDGRMARAPEAAIAIDEPLSPTGAWWAYAAFNGQRAVVEWKPGRGWCLR